MLDRSRYKNIRGPGDRRGLLPPWAKGLGGCGLVFLACTWWGCSNDESGICMPDIPIPG